MVVMGRLIKGIYKTGGVDSPDFRLTSFGLCYDHPCYDISFSTLNEFHAFTHIWERGVVGFHLLVEKPVRNPVPSITIAL